MNIPQREEGQGLVEYALLIALIAIIVLAILTLLGAQVVFVFARTAGGLQGDVLDVAAGDTAVIVSYDGASDCSSISNIRFVEADSNGALITNGSVSATVYDNGVPAGSISATAGDNGLATYSGSIGVSSCTGITLR